MLREKENYEKLKRQIEQYMAYQNLCNKIANPNLKIKRKRAASFHSIDSTEKRKQELAKQQREAARKM